VEGVEEVEEDEGVEKEEGVEGTGRAKFEGLKKRKHEGVMGNEDLQL
jgi:hypothetical protein